MKTLVTVTQHHEVLYDALTDEVVFRRVGDTETEVRVQFLEVYKARLFAKGADAGYAPAKEKKHVRRRGNEKG